jgi:hypothetical protein
LFLVQGFFGPLKRHGGTEFYSIFDSHGFWDQTILKSYFSKFPEMGPKTTASQNPEKCLILKTPLCIKLKFILSGKVLTVSVMICAEGHT